MKRILKSLCMILLAASILVSCDSGIGGIFSLLEEEKAVSTGTAILNSNTVTFVLRFNDYYYAAVGSTLVRRPVVAGSSWEKVTVTGAPTAPEGEIYAITSGVTDGTNLYISYGPVNSTILYLNTSDVWNSYATASSTAGLPNEPVQSLLYANGTLFAATQCSGPGKTTGTKMTYYKIYYKATPSTIGNFSMSTLSSIDSGATYDGSYGVASGCPCSIAWDGTNYWIAAGSTVFTGTSASSLAATDPSSYISSDDPMLYVYYNGTNVLGAGAQYLYQLATGSWTRSTILSSKAQLSSIVEVPYASGSGTAVLVSSAIRTSYTYTGYFEYDASEGIGAISPNDNHDWITTESNYVTTLDDVGNEGFYYDGDDTSGVLFARATGGELWSNTWDGTAWGIWDRE
jgi:hypothetical protein